MTARRPSPAFRSWGDLELDRLWREMYEAEMDLDDWDLTTESPKLLKAIAAAERFRAAMARKGGRP